MEEIKMNKHDIQRAGTAIFEKDRAAHSERKPPEKVPAAMITVFLFCWFDVLETVFIVRV